MRTQLFRARLSLLMELCLLFMAVAHPLQAQQLYTQGGRVLHHPSVHLVYFSSDWNSIHSDPALKKEAIDQWVSNFMVSDYFNN